MGLQRSEVQILSPRPFKRVSGLNREVNLTSWAFKEAR
jgi:hypothetical protein